LSGERAGSKRDQKKPTKEKRRPEKKEGKERPYNKTQVLVPRKRRRGGPVRLVTAPGLSHKISHTKEDGKRRGKYES